MIYRPVLNRVLVEIVEDDSAIVVAEEGQTTVKGKVISIGIGDMENPQIFCLDDVVYFRKRDSYVVELNGKILYVLQPEDILLYEEPEA